MGVLTPISKSSSDPRAAEAEARLKIWDPSRRPWGERLSHSTQVIELISSCRAHSDVDLGAQHSCAYKTLTFSNQHRLEALTVMSRPGPSGRYCANL